MATDTTWSYGRIHRHAPEPQVSRFGGGGGPRQAAAGDEGAGRRAGRPDLVWVWAVAALALWALYLTSPRTSEPDLTEGAMVIAAVAATAGTLLAISRRNTQNVAEAAAAAAVAAVEAHRAAAAREASGTAPGAPTAATAPPVRATDPTVRPQVAAPPSRPAEPPAQAVPPSAAPPAPAPAPPPPQPAAADAPGPPEPSPDAAPGPAGPDGGAEPGQEGDTLRPCPCGFCDRQVDDANGYLTSVTAWVIAVERLCKQATEAMVKGGWVHLPVYEFASDTEALRELLVQTCHEGGGTRAIWTIQGLVTVWEQTLFRVEQEIAATVEPGRYLAWHTATADIRANRHGDAT